MGRKVYQCVGTGTETSKNHQLKCYFPHEEETEENVALGQYSLTTL